MSTTTTQSALFCEQLARMAGSSSTDRPRVESPLLEIAPVTLASSIKRTIDLTGAAVGLALLAPLLLAVAALVRLTSPGPAFFRQLRLGRGGRPFYVLKFRTMVSDAELRLKDLEACNESGGVLFKIKDDPRTTSLGRFLRRTSLDELPQLINIARGEMSLVGPRPLQLRDSRLLEAQDPAAFAKRLSVTPGLTGPWQVSGRSDAGCDMVQFDLEYVDNWSLALDLKILARTLPAVATARGAC